MTAPPSSAILGDLARIRSGLVVIAELYVPAEQVAYSAIGRGESVGQVGRVGGSDPVGALAVAGVNEQTGEPTEVAALRRNMVRAANAVEAMRRESEQAIKALNRVVTARGEVVFADWRAPTTHKVGRWTVDELAAAEAEAWTRRRNGH